MRCLIAFCAGVYLGWAWATAANEPEYPKVSPTREEDHGPLFPLHGPPSPLPRFS